VKAACAPVATVAQRARENPALTDKHDDSRSPEDSRPNLFGNSAGPAAPSILSRIEPAKPGSSVLASGAEPSSRSQPWVIAIGLGAVIVAVAIWATAGRKAPGGIDEARVSVATAESRIRHDAEAPSGAASAPEVVASAAPAVAMLESLPAEEAPAAPADAAASASSNAASGVAATAVAPAAAGANSAAGQAKSAGATKPATAARSMARSSNSDAQRSARTASSQAAARERQARSRSTAAAASADADVSLLAAVIGHAEPSAAGAPGRQRDEATIAGLVQRCDAEADGIGALQCRRRICDGYWGKAQACPRRLAPASAN
jgi:hypothetical protein